MFSDKTIFFAALDWGMGHVTRSAPILRSLQSNNKIILGVTPENEHFYKVYFPEIETVSLPSYGIQYSRLFPVWLKIILQWPAIKKVIRHENKLLADYIRRYKIDLVISDSRFGLYNSGCESILISHQLNLQAPFFESFAGNKNLQMIHHFNSVWVPDFRESEKRLSGKLSDESQMKIPVKFIGPQSNLSQAPSAGTFSRFDVLILLSGVEPQRSILENALVENLRLSNKKVGLVRGTIKESSTDYGNLTVFDLPQPEALGNLIMVSDIIISRSGYSTLMDLHLLGKQNIILIPTPGQTEQEYLAKYWSKKFGAIQLDQSEVQRFDFITPLKFEKD